MHESKKAADVEVEEILKPAQRPTDETSSGPEDQVKSKPENTEEKVKKPAEDVFDFKVDEETAEPPKTIERPKQTASPTTDASECETTLGVFGKKNSFFIRVKNCEGGKIFM